jgi:hypothetical protein
VTLEEQIASFLATKAGDGNTPENRALMVADAHAGVSGITIIDNTTPVYVRNVDETLGELLTTLNYGMPS